MTGQAQETVEIVATLVARPGMETALINAVMEIVQKVLSGELEHGASAPGIRLDFADF